MSFSFYAGYPAASAIIPVRGIHLTDRAQLRGSHWMGPIRTSRSYGQLG